MRQGSIDIVHGAATKEWLREQIQTFGPGPVLGHHTISIDAAVRAHARRCGGVPVLEEIRKSRPRIERPNPEAWVYG